MTQYQIGKDIYALSQRIAVLENIVQELENKAERNDEEQDDEKKDPEA